MSDVTRIVARAIQNDQNNNFKMVLIDVAIAFESHGFFQCENWREILNESFNPTVRSGMENQNYFPVVASRSTSNKVPENVCDNSDERNRCSTFHCDDDSDDDDNLLVPIGIRTPSPIKSISKNENIQIEAKVENEMETPVESTKNNEIRRVHSFNWAQLCSKVNQGQEQFNALQREDIQIMTVFDSVFDENMDSGCELRVANKKTKDNERKHKLSEVVTDSTMSPAGATRRKPNPPMEPISSASLHDTEVPQFRKPVLKNIINTRRMTRLQSRLLASGMQSDLVSNIALNTVSSVGTNQTTKTRRNTDKVSNASTGRRVMFTRVKSEQFELLLKTLHITVATVNTDFDVLVTNEIRRSTKFMIALGSGKPIVSTEWLNAMEKSNSWVDPFLYLLYDESGEKKYQFSLKKTIKAASEEKLFKDCSILVTPKTSPNPEELKAVIVSSGGKYMKTTLVPRKGDRIICVSDTKDKKMWPRLLKKYPSLSDIIHVNGFVQAIFAHSLDIKDYRLQN